MKKFVNVTLILLILLISGCRLQNYQKNKYLEKNSNSAARDKFDPSFSINIENLSGKSKFPREVFLGKGQEYTGRIAISNSSKFDEQYGLMILKNYEQVPFYVANKKYDFYKLGVKAKSSGNFIVKTQRFSKGFFDVDFVVTARPDDLSKDFEARKLSPDTVFVYRSNFFVDSKEAQKIKFIDKANAKNLFNENVIINRLKIKNLDQNIWFHDKITNNNKDLKYHIYAANNFDKKITFAVVAFLNYRQINVLEEKAYFGQLESQEAVNIPTKVMLSKKKNELFAIFIPKPFSQIGKEPKQSTVDEEMAQSSFRVALDR